MRANRHHEKYAGLVIVSRQVGAKGCDAVEGRCRNWRGSKTQRSRHAPHFCRPTSARYETRRSTGKYEDPCPYRLAWW